MDKKQQMSRNFTDLKIYGTKNHTKEFVSEKYPAFHQQKKNTSPLLNYFPKSTHKQKSKFHPASAGVSLSNEDYIMANAQIWVQQDIDVYDDVYNNWDDIVQINFFTNEDLKCPICLGTPIAPRTDRCGHIYCLPCLRKYLSYSSEFKNNCALCNQAIQMSRIKRAGVIHTGSLQSGDDVSMVLMRRGKFDRYPLPMSSVPHSLPIANSHESQFSNVAICSNDDMLSILQMEIMSLEEEFEEAVVDGDDRVDVISEALHSVRSEFQCLSVTSGCSSQPISKHKSIDEDQLTKDMLDEAMQAGSVYYQAEGGSNIFMSPVNWRCLASEYLDKGLCLPLRVQAPLVEVEKFSVTEETAGRYRYMRGLPPGSTASFVELSLEGVVSEASLGRNRALLDARAEQRQRRIEDDLELTARKARVEDGFLGRQERGLVRLESLAGRLGAVPLGGGGERTFREALAGGSRPLQEAPPVPLEEEAIPQRSNLTLGDCIVVVKGRKGRRQGGR